MTRLVYLQEEGTLIESAAVAYHSVELAKLKNPSNITILETNPTRAKKAMEYGIVNNAFDPREENIVEKLLTSTNGGYDSVIECVVIKWLLMKVLSCIKVEKLRQKNI